jgi:hypothetical protein
MHQLAEAKLRRYHHFGLMFGLGIILVGIVASIAFMLCGCYITAYFVILVTLILVGVIGFGLNWIAFYSGEHPRYRRVPVTPTPTPTPTPAPAPAPAHTPARDYSSTSTSLLLLMSSLSL